MSERGSGGNPPTPQQHESRRSRRGRGGRGGGNRPSPADRPDRKGRGGGNSRGGGSGADNDGDGGGQQQPARSPRGRGGGGGRRGRGGRGRSGGRRSGGGGGRGGGDRDYGGAGRVASIGDEEVLIAFMPYMRGDDRDAREIHNRYGDDPRTFVSAARNFLLRRANGPVGTNLSSNDRQELRKGIDDRSYTNDTVGLDGSTNASVDNLSTSVTASEGGKYNSPPTMNVPVAEAESISAILTETEVRAVDRMLHNVLLQERSSHVVSSSSLTSSSTPRPLPPSPAPHGYPPGFCSPQKILPSLVAAITISDSDIQRVRSPVHPKIDSHSQKLTQNSEPILSPPSPGLSPRAPFRENDPSFSPTANGNSQPTKSSTLETTVAEGGKITKGKTGTAAEGAVAEVAESTPHPVPVRREWQPKRVNTRLDQQPGKIMANGVPAAPEGLSFLTLGPRRELVARWMLPLSFLRERTLKKLKGEGGSEDSCEVMPPTEAVAQNITIRDALRSLSVGLFRRGCAENGDTHSIVSKEIVPRSESGTGPSGGGGAYVSSSHGISEYPFEVDSASGCVWGDVPFYTPRTPGNVVPRLYFADEPRITLGTGPCIRVRVNDGDVELTLRFVLSNFKSKKGTANFSSLHSLAAVLEQFSPSTNYAPNRGGHHRNQNQYSHAIYEGACRAAWGCLAEARKVVDYCYSEYTKTRDKLIRQEDVASSRIHAFEDEEKTYDSDKNESVVLNKTPFPSDRNETNKVKSGSESALPIPNSSVDMKTTNESSDNKKEEDLSFSSTDIEKAKEKLGKIGAEKASNEKKWREMQSAFASILRAAIFNSACHLIIKRDVITKLRCEYELWCPLCESFAPNPFVKKDSDRARKSEGTGASTQTSSPWSSQKFPHHVESHHFQLCRDSRARMQQEFLGFVPNHNKLHTSLNKSNSSSFLDNLSVAMDDLYTEEYATSSWMHQRRERARVNVEQIVSQSDVFPKGTRVVIFGSCANGFGSPNSDLDMCLQLPPSTDLSDYEGNAGSSAMAKIAEQLNATGMKNVDTVRLTARIPVVMFDYPMTSEIGAPELHSRNEKVPVVLECDLSMQNPLACLNTSLLLSYSNISPQTRVLVSIIKRWAKRRDINNPAKHTVSSYGYILMLLQFLTTHYTKADGQVVPVPSADEVAGQQNKPGHGPPPITPLLPNLQWMDQVWPQTSMETPYREMTQKPQNNYCLMAHPTEPSFVVNSYFFRLTDPNAMTTLQERFSADNDTPVRNRPSVASLLAAFFRYYAFEFDYRRQVVSLNATLTHGSIDKETKAEQDGWSLYRQVLSIEDPFETFYDVAHVLKQNSFQRVRREFALAYTKIVDSAIKNDKTGRDIIDFICEPLSEND